MSEFALCVRTKVGFTNKLANLKKNVSLKPILGLPLFVAMLQQASDNVVVMLQSKGSEAYLRTLEEDVKQSGNVAVPQSGCSMPFVTRQAFALGPLRARITSIKTCAAKGWIESRSQRIRDVEMVYENMIRNLVGCQLKQLWSCLGEIMKTLTALLSCGEEGGTYDELLAATKNALNAPTFLASCASTDNSGLSKTMSEKGKASPRLFSSVGVPNPAPDITGHGF